MSLKDLIKRKEYNEKYRINNKDKIKAAFSPENHQWVTKEFNLIKNDKVIQC
jgi:hypothetical protein